MNHNLDNCIAFIHKTNNHTIGMVEFNSREEAEFAASKITEFKENYMITNTELDRYNEFLKFMNEEYQIMGYWISIPADRKVYVDW